MKEQNEKTIEQPIQIKVKEQTEKLINNLLEEQINNENLECLYTLVDIHKDMTQEEYWKEKLNMRYRGYEGNYGDNDSYGRRGVPGTGRGRYRGQGEEALDEMSYHYGNYMGSGNYGAKEDSSYKMIECFKDFGYAISQELEPKDKKMFKQAMQEVMQELDR